jgi:hypothetical protein
MSDNPKIEAGIDRELGEMRREQELERTTSPGLRSSPTGAASQPRVDGKPQARRSQATHLVDLALAAGIELWHDAASDPYVTLPIDGHHEHHRLGAQAVREWLARRYHATTRSTPSAHAITDARTALGGIARYEGAEHETAVRVAGSGGAVYVDLGDPAWRAIEISPAGWAIEPKPRVRFIRARGARPLVMPAHGGSIDALRELVHVLSDDDYRLIVGWLLGALRPTGPYPLLALAGEQGAGKSTAARVIRRLVDPSIAELRAEPRTIDDVMIAASRSRVVALDNLSHIEPWLSDALCRLSTGGALTKRELYTDGEEVILEAVRPAIITSVTDVVVRGDLLDRAIAITLPSVAESARLTEDALWSRFAVAAPGILGALLDSIAAALTGEREIAIERLPRMADWARWVTAAEPGLGWLQGQILDAYREVRTAAVEAAVDGDPLAVGIRRMSLPWSGTAADLLALLAPSGRAPRGWPESPRALAAALRRLAPGLRAVGIEIANHREAHTGRRLIRLDRHADDQPDTSSPSSPSSPPTDLLAGSGDDGGRTSSPTSSPDSASKHEHRDDGDDGDDRYVLSQGEDDGIRL